MMSILKHKVYTIRFGVTIKKKKLLHHFLFIFMNIILFNAWCQSTRLCHDGVSLVDYNTGVPGVSLVYYNTVVSVW